MSTIKFNEENLNTPYHVPSTDLDSSTMVRMLIRTNLVKNKFQARAVLLLIAIVFIVAAILTLYFGVVHSGHPPIYAK
jgi:hypothetical protein